MNLVAGKDTKYIPWDPLWLEMDMGFTQSFLATKANIKT